MCFRDWSCPYQELLVQAETPSLAERREQAKLCHLYKIVHGLTDCQSAPVQVKSPAYNTRQVTDFTLENIRATTSQFLYSFFPHSISLWNSQSTNTQTALSFYTFKHGYYNPNLLIYVINIILFTLLVICMVSCQY